MKCPRCKKNELDKDQVMNSLSHRDDKTYICSPCGDEESMIDQGYVGTNQVELDFIESLKAKS